MPPGNMSEMRPMPPIGGMMNMPPQPHAAPGGPMPMPGMGMQVSQMNF